MAGGAPRTPPQAGSEEDEQKQLGARTEALQTFTMVPNITDNSEHIEQLHTEQEKAPQADSGSVLSSLDRFFKEKIKAGREKTRPIREGLKEAGEVVSGVGQAAKALYIDTPIEIYKELTKDRSKK